MKKEIRIVLFLLAAIFCIHSAAAPVAVSAAPQKNGLVKEKGNYYYYVKGKKQFNTWKTVKTGGKKYKYYFGKSGAAYKASEKDGIIVPAVKKIGKYTYGFDQDGRMLTGVQTIKGKDYKFYVFSGSGRLNTKKTTKLREASKSNKPLAPLKKLLKKYGVKCKKTEYYGYSCYGDGYDGIAYFDNFQIAVFKQANGAEIVFGIYPKEV